LTAGKNTPLNNRELNARETELVKSMDAFEILMVIALGSLAGTGIGIILGWLVNTQKREGSVSIRNDKNITIGLIVVCSFLCIAVIGYYSLFD